MAQRELFYILRDNSVGIHESMDAMAVFGAMKQLRESIEPDNGLTLAEIAGCFDSQKGWFAGDCSGKVQRALDNLVRYKFVKKSSEGASYSLV